MDSHDMIQMFQGNAAREAQATWIALEPMKGEVR